MVRVSRLENNTKIVLRKGNNIKTKVFYTPLTKEELLEYVTNNYSSEGNVCVTFNVIKDNESSHPFHIKTDVPVSELRNDLYKKLLADQIIQDAKLHVKTLKIINLITKNHESKQITFNSKESLDDLFDFFDSLVRKVIKDEDDKQICFVDEVNTRKTHQWSIIDGKKVKSQQIKLDGVSCPDLMKMILKKIKVFK